MTKYKPKKDKPKKDHPWRTSIALYKLAKAKTGRGPHEDSLRIKQCRFCGLMIFMDEVCDCEGAHEYKIKHGLKFWYEVTTKKRSTNCA